MFSFVRRSAVVIGRSWVAPILRATSQARTLGLAAEMSFWLFLALVPLAAVAGVVLARQARADMALASMLLSSVPVEARTLVADQVGLVAKAGNSTVAPLAVATFLWLASSGVHSVFDCLEIQAGVTRPRWTKRLIALATCLVLAAAVAALGLLGSWLGWMDALAAAPLRALTEGPLVVDLLQGAASASLAVALVAGLYRAGIPRVARRRFPVLPGAVLSVGTSRLLGWGYRGYVSTVGDGGAYVGGLAVIGVTLITLWLFSVSILLGAALNRVVGERQTTG